MAKRMVSPFDPSQKAYLEPIEQPIYSSAPMTAATPERRVTFFPVPAASQGDPVRSNLDQNRLANPKLFVVRGWRLHFGQNVVFVDSGANSGDQARALAQILENYYYEFSVGEKAYLTVPGFACPSGLGVYGMFSYAGAEAANEALYTAVNGWPHKENHRQLKRNEITIPPQQSFKAELIMSNTSLATFLGSDRRVWTLIEGTLGREVQ